MIHFPDLFESEDSHYPSHILIGGLQGPDKDRDKQAATS